MLSLHISSKAGTEIFKGEYQIIDDINGIPTLETDYSKTKYNHEEPLFMMSNAYTDKFVMIIKEQSSKGENNKTRYTGVHSFIYDFSLDRIYDTYTQYFSLENALSLLFDGTGYDFEVKADQTYYALDFQNFGDDDKMNLLNKICERWELEYHITGNTVVFGQRRGQKTNKQFRYKMNITDSSVDLDISEGATYIRATFGSEEKGTLTEREMTHPLAERFGIRHAKPYSNENITLEETMQKYMQQKIEDTWKLSIKIDISDIEGSGDIEVGDTVWAIDERLDLSYNTRVVELKRYYNKNDEVYKTEAVIGNRTFADRMSTQERTPQQEIEDNVIDQTNKKLAELQAKFDNDFNAARDEYRNLFDSAVIAAENEVQAAEQRMTALIGQARDDFDTEFNAEIERIEQEALAEYDRISGEITDTIDQARTEMEQDYNQAVQDARDYAEQAVSDMDEAMREDFSVWTGDLQNLRNDYLASITEIDGTFAGIDTNITDISDRVDDVFADVSDIQGFIGDTTTSLNEKLQNISLDFNERIDNINVNTRNLLRGTLFNEGLWATQNSVTLHEDERINYYRFHETGSAIPFIYPNEMVEFSENETYRLYLDYRTSDVTELDFLDIRIGGNTSVTISLITDNHLNLNTDGQWHTVMIEFVATSAGSGSLWIGTNYNAGVSPKGDIDLRLPYLTSSKNDTWLPHPLDNTQSIEEVTRRITELEDGRHELITRTEYDFDTGVLDGTIREIRETVDESSSTIANHEEWFTTNGSNVLQTVDEVSSKVWNTDIANIGANLIPMSSNAWEDGSVSSTTGNLISLAGRIRLINPIEIRNNQSYTIQDNSLYVSAINQIHVYVYDNGTFVQWFYISRGGTRTFVAQGNELRIALTPIDGFAVQSHFIDSIDKRVQMKLEEGSNATPMMGFMSNVEQLANRVSTTVYGTDGLESTVAQQVVEVGRIEGLVTDADGKASQALQTVDGFSNTVTDLSNSVNANANLLPMHYDNWERGFISSTSGNNTLNGDMFLYRTKGYMAVFQPTQLHFSAPNYGQFEISLRYYNLNFEFIGWDNYRPRGNTFSPPEFTRYVRAIFRRVNGNELYLQNWLYNTKLEVGNERTEAINAISQLEQRADAIEMTVQDVDLSGVIRQSDISVQPTGVTIGSAYLGENELASMFRVMPNAIEAITDEMRITGNLKVAGDIKSLSISAVEGNFASIFASTADIDFITARHMNANSVGAKHLYVDNALIDKLSASTIFTNMLSTKTLDAIDANIGSVRTSLLTSNVITSGMIQSSNATINKLFSNNARIDTLVSKAHFVDEIKAMSISAVNADIANIRSKILTSDVINSTHIKSDNAIIDKLFATSALIERLTSKKAFISYIRSHIIDADTVQVGFNGVSDSVRITGSGLETYDGSKRTSLLDKIGHRFYEDGIHTGQIGVSHIVNTPERRGLRFLASQSASFLAWSKQTGTGVAENLMTWFADGNNTGFIFHDTIRFQERLHSTKRIYANSGVYFDENNDSQILRIGTNLELRHNNNGSGISLHNNGAISFTNYGSITHAFFANGTKTGGSIEIEGTRYGMSPIDSPQVLIEYVEFDVELSRFGTKIMLDETYLKSVVNFAVFLNNGELVSKNKDHVIVKGEGTTDIRFVGERIEHDNVMWADLRTKEDVEEVIEHESEPAPQLYMDRTRTTESRIRGRRTRISDTKRHILWRTAR